MKRSFEEWLLDHKIITKEMFDDVITCNKKEAYMYESLIKQGIMTEWELAQKLAEYMQLDTIDLLHEPINPHIANRLSEDFCRYHQVIAVTEEDQKIIVAVSDPRDLFLLEDIRLMIGQAIIFKISPQPLIEKAINKVFSTTLASKLVDKVAPKSHVQSIKEASPPIKGDMTRFVYSVIEKAIYMSASDIHIQPLQQKSIIRYRIDGVLYPQMEVPTKQAMEQLVICIKTMSNLDITEKRLPQDGRICEVITGEAVDFRVSTLPTIYGEKLVIRCIYRQHKSFSLETLGFKGGVLDEVQKMSCLPQGLVIATGPTGSGKSTTLATLMRKINDGKKNIITIEDPVESIIEGISQIEVNAFIGLDFEDVLRTIFRQDPDVVMIGEMRDSKTAITATRAAITGHVVYSTLHTNDGSSTIVRLIDMGVPAYMVAAALKAVISQRLIRKICPHCRESYTATVKDSYMYAIEEGSRVYKARGCNACNHTGSFGRMAIYEVLVMDEQLRQMISEKQVSAQYIRQYMKGKGIKLLKDEVKQSVLKGEASIEEMAKVMELEG